MVKEEVWVSSEDAEVIYERKRLNGDLVEVDRPHHSEGGSLREHPLPWHATEYQVVPSDVAAFCAALGYQVYPEVSTVGERIH